MSASLLRRDCSASKALPRRALTPTSFVSRQARKIIPHLDGPIADVACGTGRNLIPFVHTGHPLFCYDFDTLHLDFVHTSFADLDLHTERVDLRNPGFVLPEGYFSLLILVHFYDRNLIQRIMRSVKPGGFLLIESIEARRGNYSGLPGRGEIICILRKTFNVLRYIHKDVEPLGRETVKLVARRNSR